MLNRWIGAARTNPLCKCLNRPLTFSCVSIRPHFHQEIYFRTFASQKSINSTKSPNKTDKNSQNKADKNKQGDHTKYAFVLQDVTKRIHNQVLFENVNLSFYEGAKIGVLGVNGSGKSSLLKIIAGIDKEFLGKASSHPSYHIGYLQQEPILDENKTVLENILDGVRDKKNMLDRFEQIAQEFSNPNADYEKLLQEQADLQAKIEEYNCWELSRRINVAMDALRCPPSESPVTHLSGGERRRVALCRLLISEPDVLLLDEPTNHLDAESVAWIETFLHQYKGMVIAVTHDRYFLDNVAGYILELDGGKCYPFKGNYAAWLESKAKRLELQQRKDEHRAKLMARELEWVRSSPSARQAKSKARLKAFQQLQEQQNALSTSSSGALVIPKAPRLGSVVLTINNLKMILDGQLLFENLSFSLDPGAILGVIGPNGSGKTTLLRLIRGELSPTSGTVSIGDTVRLAYNAQSREGLDPNKSIWQEIAGSDDVIELGDGLKMNARAYVAQFNFRGNAQLKTISMLSGGERNRVQLAKSLRTGANVILLDEPTNDLDVDTLRALEEALRDFNGSAIVVSHDRWFLDRICSHILAFDENGKVTFFNGNFSEFEKMKKEALGDYFQPKRKFKKLVK